MGCETLTSPEVRIAELEKRLRAFTDFALAQADWEKHAGWFLDAKCGGWIGTLSDSLLQDLEEVARLRDEALGL